MATSPNSLRRRPRAPPPILSRPRIRNSPPGSDRLPARRSPAPTSKSAGLSADSDSPYPRSDNSPVGPEEPTPGTSIHERPTGRYTSSLTPPPTAELASPDPLHGASLLDILDGSWPARIHRDRSELRDNHLPRPADGRDSHPDPFERLAGSSPRESRFDMYQRLAHEQLLHEFESTLIAAPRRRGDPVQQQTPLRSDMDQRRSQSRSRNSPTVTRGSNFPNGGLDFDVDGNDSTDDHPQDPQNTDLQRCNRQVDRLEQSNEELRENISLRSIEHDQQMDDVQTKLEEAEIEADRLAEELQEREETVLNLQQQLDESTTRADQPQDDDTGTANDSSQHDLAQMHSLNEKLIEANARIEGLTVQLARSNRTVAHLRANMQKNDSRSPREASESDNMVQVLVVNDNEIQGQLEDCNAHRQESDRELTDLRRKLADYAAYSRQRDAAIERKEDRLDALWNALRHLEVVPDATVVEVETLRARITYLEALKTNARDEINQRYQQPNPRTKDETASNDEPVSDEGTTRSIEEAEVNATLLEHIDLLDHHVADAYRQLRESLAANKDLQQTIDRANQQRVQEEQARVLIDERDEALGHLLIDARATLADQETEMEALRDELQTARDEITRLRDEDDVHDNHNNSNFNIDSGFVERGSSNEPDELARAKRSGSSPPEIDDSGFVDGGTPIESDELPRARRFTSSPREVDYEYDGQSGDEDLDDLISPSSFVESEPSPLLPRLRRSGRTRRQSRRLTSSINEYESADEEEAQFQRDLAAVAPAHPRGLVVVVDQGECARAMGNGHGLKRKRN